MDSKYQVILLDQDGCHISVDEADSLKAAKIKARYLFSEDYARQAETTHARLGTYKVEIRNADGICLWDDFYP